MKIIDFLIVPKSYRLISKVTSFVTDPDGALIKEHGRPVTFSKNISVVKNIYKVKFLVESGGMREWMFESDIVRKFGKKKYRNQSRKVRREVMQVFTDQKSLSQAAKGLNDPSIAQG